MAREVTRREREERRERRKRETEKSARLKRSEREGAGDKVLSGSGLRSSGPYTPPLLRHGAGEEKVVASLWPV